MYTFDAAGKLREAGLRPTRQRVCLANLLFRDGDRHVTAERLHEDAVLDNFCVSLATVYNTLNQFTQAGLLREVAIEGSKTYLLVAGANCSVPEMRSCRCRRHR